MSGYGLRLLVLALLIGLPGASRADGLFKDIPATRAAAATAAADAQATKFPATVKRSRMVALDKDYLAARVMPDAPMSVGNKVASKPLGVDVPLFPDLSVVLSGKHVEQVGSGRTVWTGSVVGAPDSLVLLVVDGESVTGQIFDGPTVIEIRQVAGDVHKIVEIDAEKFPGHEHVVDDPARPMVGSSPGGDAPAHHHGTPDVASPARGQSGQAQSPVMGKAAPAASTTLNIYVAYTAATAAASSNIVSEIQLSIASANAAFTNSGVNTQLNLVGTGQVTYTEGTYTTSSNILTKFTTNNDGVMDTIHTLRTANNADLAALFVENLYDACGIAWVYNGQPAYAFTVTQRSCATAGLTLAHETGHNLGAYHDRYVQPEATGNIYAYGYVDTTNRFQTIMSYSDKCTSLGISCSRIPYFSSPSVTYQGKSTGIDRSLSSSADNARKFNETVTSIARFRSGTSTALPESGWWWGSTESGRGYSLEVSGNNLFFAFYSYASDGTPVWYVSSGAMTSSNQYFAAMQQYRGGQTLSGSYQAATSAGTPGWVDIVFSNDRTGTIYFWSSSTGWTDGTAINRFDFVTNGAAIGPASGYPQTGWWWNASEPGRGFFIEAQNTTMFVSFYMYNSAGQATWYVASGSMVSSSLFSGTLSTYSGGSYFTASTFRAPSTSTTVGTVSIQFSSTTTATMTLPNGTQIPLTRFAF